MYAGYTMKELRLKLEKLNHGTVEEIDIVDALRPFAPTYNKPEVKARFEILVTKVATMLSYDQKEWHHVRTDSYLLRARAVPGGSKGSVIEHPIVAIGEPDFPTILAHGTTAEGVKGIWKNGPLPGSMLKYGGRDESHFLGVNTPKGIGEKSPTDLSTL